MTAPTTEQSRPRPRKGRATRAAVAVVAGITLLAACGGAPEESGGAGLQEVTFLNILPLESLTFAPEMVADTAGFFEQQGLDVNFEATQGSAPAIQTVIAGSAQITRVGDIETMIAAGERGAPLVTVGAALKQGPIRMISSTRAPIATAEDFAGKLVGTPSEGGTSSITLDLVAGSGGVPPEEVRRQVVGLAPGVFDLVQAGRVDAFIVSLDTAVLLGQSQPEAVVYDPNDDISAGSQIYVTSAEQAQDPAVQDQLRRYLQAIRQAMEFIIADADGGFAETTRLIGSEYTVPALADPAVAAEALQGYVDSYVADGEQELVTTSPERWGATYEEVVEIGLVQPGLDPMDWVNGDLAPQPSS